MHFMVIVYFESYTMFRKKIVTAILDVAIRYFKHSFARLTGVPN